MRIWLHELTGNEHGWIAWSLDLMGFATWSPERSSLLGKVPGKLQAHLNWLAGAGMPAPGGVEAGVLEIVEEVRGNEVLFEFDRQPSTPAEVSLCLQLIAQTRRELLDTVVSLPDAVLDWDPPYAQFAAWARWRTIRQILSHIALTEVGYYLPAIGYSGPDPEDLLANPWGQQLAISRRASDRFLQQLAAGADLLRLSEGEESWSVRKVLRRLVWHELLHLKSIRRIVAEYAA
ncbi:MAG: DinB family protein [Anaerolineales bacterium]|nr:DinB family protein [Anaerolineales bacterium]